LKKNVGEEELDLKNQGTENKGYIGQLEQKIKELESENFRLQNLLMRYREDNFEQAGEKPRSFVNDIKDHKKKILEKFVDLNTMKAKQNPEISIIDHFKQTSGEMMEKHKKFFDAVFDMIINHVYPVSKFGYWKDLTPQYNTDFEIVKKYVKMTKYQKEEYTKDFCLNEVDKYVISLNPSKRQYEFLRNVLLKKEYELKLKFREGIELLLKAKNFLQSTNLELFELVNLIIKGEVFSDQQLIKSKMKSDFLKNIDTINEIWKINISSTELSMDMAKDSILGASATKLLKRKDQIQKTTFNFYKMPLISEE